MAGRDYYAAFVNGLQSITVPFDTSTNSSVVPKEFDTRGTIVAVIAEILGAPMSESVVAGPLVLLQQPASVTNIDAVA